MPKQINLVGQRFGRLLVAAKGEPKNNRSQYVCKCDCGTEKTIPSAYLLHGNVRSCGCLRAETSAATARNKLDASAKTHHPLYKRWQSMKQRCSNPANPFFKNYGARGIAVCNRWASSFWAFVDDMGLPPDAGATIERINNNLGYAPENCRWASRRDQLRNQRRSIIITCNGKTLPAKDWAAQIGIEYQRITYAFRAGGIELATALVQSHLTVT